jgi:hypothetical protein
MVIQSEIKDAIDKNMELMLIQTKAYLPFLKVAFPAVRDLSELAFNMMMGNALTVFISQFAFRMQSPSESDFTEFGKIVEVYRSKVKELF